MGAKKIPLRQCIGCGEMKSKKEMIRVLKTAEGDILIDSTGYRGGGGIGEHEKKVPGYVRKLPRKHLFSGQQG